MSALERELMFQINAHKIRLPEEQYRFAADIVGFGKGIRQRLSQAGLKDWRFDFAWPGIMFAVEVEGITPQGGRHQNIKGFRQDLEKYHHAMVNGWTIYRTGRELIRSGQSVRFIHQKVMGWNYAK